MNTTHRHETHTRLENLSLVEAVIGRRSWDDDEDADGVIVTAYTERAQADRDQARLAAQGLEATVASASTDPRVYLYVTVGGAS